MQGTEPKHCKKQGQNHDKFYAKPIKIIVWVSEIPSKKEILLGDWDENKPASKS